MLIVSKIYFYFMFNNYFYSKLSNFLTKINSQRIFYVETPNML